MEALNVLQVPINATLGQFWLVPIASILALVFAWFFFKNMMKILNQTKLAMVGILLDFRLLHSKILF